MFPFLEGQAKHTPSAIAVDDGIQQWTYQHLDERANQLAHTLQKQGVGPNTLVGLHIDRSIDIILAIFGVLKAGGAYVPLDPHYPTERLHLILQETQPHLLLTQEALEGSPVVGDRPRLCLDRDWEAIAQAPTTPPSTDVGPEHLAYILYTSGSTGHPKGVQMSRGTVARYIQALSDIIRLRADDTYLHVASFAFSSSVRQLLLPLAQGARLRIAHRDEVRDPLKLFALMQSAQVTVSDGTSSVWQYGLKALETLETPQRQALTPTHLRWAILSGEVTSCALYQAIRQHLKGTPQFVNVYGQTETVGNTAYLVPTDFSRHEGMLPVGHPYPYARAYILDDDLQPVAPGVVGELYMAGGCLAQGYFKRPGLTTEKFIPNPWVDRDGADVPTLLKTGDRVRQLPDGALELVGRVDFQVKIRGMRVELGEIEAVLEQHPHLKEAVVVAQDRSDRNNEKQLVAYGVPQQPFPQVDSTRMIAELRQWLGDRLPDYMVPAHLVLLEALPRTPSGKRDRQALSAKANVQPNAQRPIVRPKNDLEIQLRDIWELVLGVTPIGTTDSFFDLGGHSLLAAQVLTHVEQISGIRLSLATLLTAPTIGQLAEVLHQHSDARPWPCLVPVQPLEGTTHLFCVHGIFGNVMNFVELARALGPGYSVYGLQAQGLDGKLPPLERVEAMATRYVEEIKRVQPHGPYYLAGYSFGGNIAFEMAQQLTQAGGEVAQVILLDTFGPHIFRQVPLPEKLQHHTRRILKQGPQYLLEKLHKRLAKKQNQTPQESRSMVQTLFGISDQPQGNTSYSAQSLVVQAAHARAMRAYYPQPYAGNVLLVRAQILNPDEAWYVDPLLGWGQVVMGNLDVHHGSGHHITMLTPPHVQELAAILKPYLSPVQHSSHEPQLALNG